MEFGAKVIYIFPDSLPLIGGFRLTETVTTTWAIMAILMGGSYLLTRNLEKIPKGVQNMLEVFVDVVYNLVGSTMGEDKIRFAPYIGTLMMYLAFANLAGLLAVRPPTADLNTTLALALMTFFLIHFNGLRSKGLLGYLKGFIEPFPMLLPINILGELATPISLSFRLFGNIVGGMIIMSLIYTALGGALTIGGIGFLQLGIPAVLHVYFDLFSGLLQTFIFAMLSMIFISGAMD